MQEPKWKLKMWYYTKTEAEKVARGFRTKGQQVRITSAPNLNRPSAGGKHIYDVWYRPESKRRKRGRIVR